MQCCQRPDPDNVVYRRSAIRFFNLSHVLVRVCEIELFHMSKRSDVQEIALPHRLANFRIVSEAKPTAVRRKKSINVTQPVYHRDIGKDL